ncbi:MAG: hypothetical protein ACK5N8_06615 [Alphaproteobacteria bacterium]
MSDKIKLLVTSVVLMNRQQLDEYLERIEERVEDTDQFRKSLEEGEQTGIVYPDGTTTTYQIISEMQQ